MSTGASLIGKAVTFKVGRSQKTFQGVVRVAKERGRVLVESFEDGQTKQRNVFAGSCKVVE